MLPESAVREAEIHATEHEIYQPSPEIVQSAWIQDWESVARRAEVDPEGFQAEQARGLEWFSSVAD